jgi:N6-adenosine-specific RNA methylase IME4
MAPTPWPKSWTTEKARCILADPPWQFRDKLDKTRTLARHYETMRLAELAALPVWEIAEDDSVLLLWCPASMLWEGYTTLVSWGFVYKTMLVWIKPRIGMGHYFRTAHECLLLGVRGHPKVQYHSQPSWIMAPVQEHSHKPEEVYDILERMFPRPYVELFARKKRAGWRSWGKEV